MKESNRPAHMKAGNTIFVIVLIVFTLLGGILLNPLLEGYSYEGSSRLFILAMIQALIVVFIAMCAVEYIQKRMGCLYNRVYNLTCHLGIEQNKDGIVLCLLDDPVKKALQNVLFLRVLAVILLLNICLL